MPSPIKNSNKGGRREGQKYKALLVWQFLLKRTDEDHAVSSKAIKEYLELYGITADRHSIARDINELQLIFNNDGDGDIDECEQLRYETVYDNKLHGYKISTRPYDFLELRLLAECVNAAKFLTENQVRNLKELISEFCSEPQIEELNNEVYLIGRVKSLNNHIMGYIITINTAIKNKQKIKFKYLKYDLKHSAEQVERRSGSEYVYSPFQLIINEGNYYLLAFDTKKQDMRTFRVDRMKDVKLVDESREGDTVFNELDMRTYTKRVFHMFTGTQKRVSIRFTNDMLDTVVDRFGNTGDVTYLHDDGRHFIVSADIEISDQFFSWICGFRKKAVIISPHDVVDSMKTFLKDISNRYESR